MTVEMRDRRVLITGAAGGVGRALGQRLAQLGARVFLADRDAGRLGQLADELAIGGQWFAGDLAGPEAVAGLFAQVDATLGGLDAMVACAGIGSDPLMAFEDESWRDVVACNLVSYVACTRAAVDRIRLAPRGTGSIVLIGSISVHIKAIGESVYNAAKGGVASFAETLRKELMADEIRVTLIEPGAIGTAMQPFEPAERETLVEQHQLLPPGEVAEAVLFALTRPVGVDCVTLRIEPMHQKIW